MTNDVADAYERLQKRLASFECGNNWRAEQAELALTVLLASPDREGNPAHMVRNALSEASKKLKRRTALEERYERSLDWAAEKPVDEPGYLGVEVIDLVDRMKPADRDLLRLCAHGFEADQIADVFELSVERARERISRARRRAKAAA